MPRSEITRQAPHRRIYMYYMLRDCWHCQFLEADLKTPLPEKLSFRDPQKIFDLAERGGYAMNWGCPLG